LPDPIAIDPSGFEFGITIHQGMTWDRLRYPRGLCRSSMGKSPATSYYVRRRHRLWSVEVFFDGEGKIFLDNGWRCFARRHAIEVGHFVVFKYDGHIMLTVKAFDNTMWHRHYHTDEDD
jgi:hypothetical protein